jgi:predicted GH43/DUF377 family glycosyl hydrolase
MRHAYDELIFTPRDVDLSRSPLAGKVHAETYVLGAFNPGMTRLPNGNLLLMVRVAEALREPVEDGHMRAMRWDGGELHLDRWPLQNVDSSDARKFRVLDNVWKVLALTSLSWLLPVELDPVGREIVEVHYGRAIAPQRSYQCYGVEDARISRVRGRYLMTTCSVSPERHSTTLYSSDDALDWTLEGIVLDHQNKDMLIFEGLVGDRYWAQTRPLGDLYFTYPPGSPWLAGPSIQLASSPDALHWRPCERPGLRPHSGTLSTARMGGGSPPIRSERGWLSLWHGVEPNGIVGIYRTYWTLLDHQQPWKVVDTSHEALLEPRPDLTAPWQDLMYLDNVVFTTGIADAGDVYVVASGEADLACRITHVDKALFSV